MAFSYRENFIKFGFDPYQFIREGIDLALENNLGIYMTESRVVNSSTLPNTEKARRKPYNWSGYNPNSNLSVTQQLDINMLGSFIDQDLINEFEDVFSEINAKLDLGKDSKPARIKFTDKPIGVFSFSQASKGLIRPVEYFSLKEQKVIKADYVFSRKEYGSDFFYYFIEGDEYEVQRRQEGTTAISNVCPSVKIKYDETTKLFLPFDEENKIVNKCKDKRLRFTSTNKKVYAFREKKGGGVAPYVDLYIPIGGNWTFDPEQMLIRAIPSIMLGRILERSGVRVRIFAVYSQEQVRGGSKTVNLIFKVKDYGETTDVNRLAVFSADPRFFRYHLFNAQIGHNFSLTGFDDMNPSQSGANYGEFSNLIMPAIRNVVDYKIKVGEFPSQIVDKRLMIYGGVDSNTKEEISNASIEQRIVEGFYSNMDYIQLNLTKTPRVIMQEIIKRLKSKNKTDYQIKSYLQNLITNVYSTTSEIQSVTPKVLKQQFDDGILNEENYKNQLRVQIQLDTKEDQDQVREGRNKNLAILNELIN
jgi:hypothetical protein